MWPYASIFCLLGVLIGLCHGAPLLYKAFSSKPRRGSFTWGFAFLWYGIMSTGGLLYHCINPIKLFYTMDVVSTACSCVSILAAYGVFFKVDDRSAKWRSFMGISYGVILGLAMQRAQVVRDLLYVGPAGLAFGGGAWFVMKAGKGGPHGWVALAWLSCSVVGALVALASIPLDPWLCTTFGANFSMLPWFFFGCDLAMVCLYQFTLLASQDRFKTKAS